MAFFIVGGKQVHSSHSSYSFFSEYHLLFESIFPPLFHFTRMKAIQYSFEDDYSKGVLIRTSLQDNTFHVLLQNGYDLTKLDSNIQYWLMHDCMWTNNTSEFIMIFKKLRPSYQIQKMLIHDASICENSLLFSLLKLSMKI